MIHQAEREFRPGNFDEKRERDRTLKGEARMTTVRGWGIRIRSSADASERRHSENSPLHDRSHGKGQLVEDGHREGPSHGRPYVHARSWGRLISRAQGSGSGGRQTAAMDDRGSAEYHSVSGSSEHSLKT